MAMGTARSYQRLRLSLAGLLVLHILLRSIFHQPTVLLDLYLFNAIAFLAATTAFFSPPFNDHFARTSLTAAIVLWALGSTETTWNSFYATGLWNNFSDLCYILFYPLVLFGLIRALTVHRELRAMEILDVVIITCGFSSLIAMLLLKSAMKRFDGSSSSVFLSIIYPVGDLVLFTLALFYFFLEPKAARSILLLSGIAIFTVTDLYFLYTSANSGYSFAQLSDDGWLIGIAFIAESLWHHGGEIQLSERIMGAATTFAMIFSGVILTLSALNRAAIPSAALIAAIMTVALSVIRLATALQEARSARTNLELTRIDELTGLANRRRFMSEIELLGSQMGTLLLLDLDGFKSVNDTLGHDAGDTLLRQISLRFSRVIPQGSTLARLGGDEFGVIVPGPARSGLEVAMAISSTLTYPLIVEGNEIQVGVSIGRVINDGGDELLKRADSAMYEAKRAGGGTVLWKP